MPECIDKNLQDSYIRINGDSPYDDRDYFKNISDYVLLILYFITLKYRCGSGYRHCLILDYTAYNDADDYANNLKSVWSVPYLNFYINPIDVKDDNGRTFGEHPRELGVIWNMYKAVLGSRGNMILERERDLFYRLGIETGKGLIEGDTYLEFKTSPAVTMQRRCYCVKEIFVSRIDAVGMLNLIDPEKLFAHRYYPLEDTEDLEEILTERRKDGLTDKGAVYRKTESRPGEQRNGGIFWLNHYIPENVSNRILSPGILKKYSSTVDDKWDWWNPYNDNSGKFMELVRASMTIEDDPSQKEIRKRLQETASVEEKDEAQSGTKKIVCTKEPDELVGAPREVTCETTLKGEAAPKAQIKEAEGGNKEASGKIRKDNTNAGGGTYIRNIYASKVFMANGSDAISVLENTADFQELQELIEDVSRKSLSLDEENQNLTRQCLEEIRKLNSENADANTKSKAQKALSLLKTIKGTVEFTSAAATLCELVGKVISL